MNTDNLWIKHTYILCTNGFLFATSRVSGLVSIVTELNSAKFRQGLSPPCEISGGGGGGVSSSP